ncbi:3-deoxy-D-manno-octulosonic acid transferase [Cellvibrio zantedeschiae]|uniref:3-deoxy-D-manno-octulosonic acid transferase n=1 Tax=Cellvibrio zantedeschiae TaxID=1237077 RepID=A0ABQ3B3G6_9GAMM|nr:lipid IV(A) 3-deoxy-D-manno-octulosonic acid transferase [Cellvibrio zantedeschiae]GGY74890.1 3-deoxy-D-manno-octulosonic acid transferase [Cellvibrio zantedeschiae]
MRFVYTLIFYCAVPFILLRLLWRAIAAPAYAKRWSERFAFFAPLAAEKKVVWLHTVSVGEFIAALPLIRQLQMRDDLQLVVTTTTPTGSERVHASLGESVFHVYAPYDLPDVLARFIQRVKPSVLLIMETELWPNTIAACKKNNIPALLINGRMSEKSARGYEKFSGLTRPMLQSLTKALVQNKVDAARFNRIGLPAINTEVTGSIKFDLTISDDLRARAAELKREWSQDEKYVLWIAASTHQGEDEIILDAFSQLKQKSVSNLRLILVPRHPERFNSVANLCVNRGHVLARRSEKTFAHNTEIILGDTMGELLLMFGASDIAFVGGSLVPNGGHNFIEPAAWALPLLSGPHVFNFAEVAKLLTEAGALQLVPSSSELATAVKFLAEDERERQKRGNSALQVANENRGALAKSIGIIEQFL